jgi:hypothetical protein
LFIPFSFPVTTFVHLPSWHFSLPVFVFPSEILFNSLPLILPSFPTILQSFFSFVPILFASFPFHLFIFFLFLFLISHLIPPTSFSSSDVSFSWYLPAHQWFEYNKYIRYCL